MSTRRGNTTHDAQLRCAALALLPPFLEHLAGDHQVWYLLCD